LRDETLAGARVPEGHDIAVPARVRAALERSFAMDLGDLRVRDGELADRLAAVLAAGAFTCDRDGA
jgi:hypothetical protein